jgi:hypothetical protein
LAITPHLIETRAAISIVIPQTVNLISLLSPWEVVPVIVSIPLSFLMAA